MLLRVREPSLVDPDVTQRHLEDCPPTQGLRTEIEPLVPPPGFGLGAGGLEYPRFLDEFPHPCLVILVTEGSGQDSVMQLEADGLVVMLKEVHAPVVVRKQLEGRISQDAEVPLRAPGSVCHALCAQHLVSRPCKACLCQPCQHIVVAPMRWVHGDPATQGMPRVARGVEPDLRRPTHIGNVVQRRSWLPPRDFEASRCRLSGPPRAAASTRLEALKKGGEARVVPLLVWGVPPDRMTSPEDGQSPDPQATLPNVVGGFDAELVAEPPLLQRHLLTLAPPAQLLPLGVEVSTPAIGESSLAPLPRPSPRSEV